jgi:beta-N-acetylhexosaminidase
MILLCNRPDLADELLVHLKWDMTGASRARLARMHGARSPKDMNALHEDASICSSGKRVGMVGKVEQDLF